MTVEDFLDTLKELSSTLRDWEDYQDGEYLVYKEDIEGELLYMLEIIKES